MKFDVLNLVNSTVLMYSLYVITQNNDFAMCWKTKLIPAQGKRLFCSAKQHPSLNRVCQSITVEINQLHTERGATH